MRCLTASSSRPSRCVKASPHTGISIEPWDFTVRPSTTRRISASLKTPPFLFANGLLLFVVTVVPFPTALVAEYFEKPGASTAAAVYGGTFVLCSIAYNILWRTAIGRQRRLLRADVSEANIRELTRRYLWGLPLYALATAAAFVSVQATFAICLGLWVFWVVAARNT